MSGGQKRSQIPFQVTVDSNSFSVGVTSEGGCEADTNAIVALYGSLISPYFIGLVV